MKCTTSWSLVKRWCNWSSGNWPVVHSLMRCMTPNGILYLVLQPQWGFLGGSDGKESVCNVEDLGSIPEWGRSPAEGNDYPLQYSRLENSMDREAWRATAYWVTKVGHDWATLSLFSFLHTQYLCGGAWVSWWLNRWRVYWEKYKSRKKKTPIEMDFIGHLWCTRQASKCWELKDV